MSDSPPPPNVGLARLSTLVALRKKSVGVPPPPPPPRYHSAFLGLARLSRLAARRSEKNSVLCPPPFFFILDPPL